MNTKNPPAFPSLEYPVVQGGEEISTYASSDGMTLLDYFAAKAMQALLTDTEARELVLKAGYEAKMEPGEAIAKLSYEYSQAMLKEREKYI